MNNFKVGNWGVKRWSTNLVPEVDHSGSKQRILKVDHMVVDKAPLLRGHLVGDNVEALVHLHGISADDFSTKFVGDFQGQFGLARPCGPDDHDDGQFACGGHDYCKDRSIISLAAVIKLASSGLRPSM